LGPPVPLWRAQQANNAPPPVASAATPAAADAGNRECRPYTSSTTLTGRGLRVEGIACRGNDGQWRLVSEVPMR
jgi:surface antigen